MYVHEVLVKCLVKLIQEKVWLVEIDHRIAVEWDVIHQTKPNQILLCVFFTSWLILL